MTIIIVIRCPHPAYLATKYLSPPAKKKKTGGEVRTQLHKEIKKRRNIEIKIYFFDL